ncbi:phage capsid protein [Labrys neptuniae]
MSDLNTTVTRIGQINQNGAVDALFLKKFAGEVITNFERVNVALQYTQTRTITEGKSASFPRVGDIGASYHIVGTELKGKKTNQNEIVIPIDDALVSDAFLANIDEAKNHFDYRSIVTKEMGRALAKQMDRHILQVGIIASRASNVVTGAPGGSVIYQNTVGAPASAAFMTNGDHLAEAIFLAAQTLDEKDVPEEERYAFVRPAQYNALVKAVRNINSDWGGAGSFSDGKIVKIAGVQIVKTNNLPNSNIASGSVDAGTADRYVGDFTNTACLVLHKQAVATVKLWDLGMEHEYRVGNQGSLLVAKYAVGHGVLRPEGAVSIVAAASP